MGMFSVSVVDVKSKPFSGRLGLGGGSSGEDESSVNSFLSFRSLL